MYWWFEDHYMFSAAGYVAKIERYYKSLESFGRMKASHDSDGNGLISIGKDGKRVICDYDDRETILHLLTEGAKVELIRAKKERDRSIEQLKKYVSRSYGKELTDEQKEAIIRIEIVLECESR